MRFYKWKKSLRGEVFRQIDKLPSVYRLNINETLLSSKIFESISLKI